MQWAQGIRRAEARETGADEDSRSRPGRRGVSAEAGRARVHSRWGGDATGRSSPSTPAAAGWTGTNRATCCRLCAAAAEGRLLAPASRDGRAVAPAVAPPPGRAPGASGRAPPLPARAPARDPGGARPTQVQPPGSLPAGRESGVRARRRVIPPRSHTRARQAPPPKGALFVQLERGCWGGSGAPPRRKTGKAEPR